VSAARVEVRLATSDDADAVTALEQTALPRDAWSDRLVEAGVSGRVPTTVYLVASSVDEVVGYAAASIVADVAELQRIAVADAHRRTGIASALLARVEREAARRHADRILLEVRDDNAAALAFYARHAFVELDRRPRYYADGTTAVVLFKEVR
jgi:ribosomal-protein-alanine N-acetyltransferase